jgi:hypothetical protein
MAAAPLRLACRIVDRDRSARVVAAMSELVPLRLLSGKEPAMIAPAGVAYWHTTVRLKDCEIYALPPGDCAALRTPFAWLDFCKRDVTFWPIDCASSRLMAMIVQALTSPMPPNGPMAIIRWAWGMPWAAELGEPEAIIETLWRRRPASSARQDAA